MRQYRCVIPGLVRPCIFLDVVTAQQNLLNNEQELAIIKGQRLVTTVLLVKALAAAGMPLASPPCKPKLKDVVAP